MLARPSPSRRREQCYAPAMIRPALALCALLLASAANAVTIVENINGLQIGPDGKLQHFGSFMIGDDGRVTQVMTNPTPRMSRFDRMINGEGRTVLPGLIDAHGHVIDLGFAALRIDVTGTRSIAELQQRLRDYAAAHPNDAWIVGFGWNQELWAEKRFPTSADLDAAVSDRPVMLERVDEHAVVANSAAIRLAGVTAATPDPRGGRIERYASGAPAGTFVDAARGLVGRVVPRPTPAESDV